jgi:hypothetical protein
VTRPARAMPTAISDAMKMNNTVDDHDGVLFHGLYAQGTYE